MDSYLFHKVSVIIPTYNERDNMLSLLRWVSHVLDPICDYQIVVVDDNSPDGTKHVVANVMDSDKHVKLVERPSKLGLGSAVVEGFSVADGDCLVMMDGDMSHNPEDIPRLIAGLQQHDIAIGSRYVYGGLTTNWSRWRLMASRGASLLASCVTGLSYRDVTSGFAAFRGGYLRPLLSGLNPMGFKLLMEILTKGYDARVIEIPITFSNRIAGESKASLKEAITFLRLCWVLRNRRGLSE